MNIDPQIVSAVLTVLLTSIAAIIGYAIREYMNRVKPFVAITKIEGNLSSGSNIVDVLPEMVETSKLLFDISTIQLKEKSKVSELRLLHSNVGRYIREWPDLLKHFDEFNYSVSRNDPDTTRKILLKILENDIYDEWISWSLCKLPITIPQPCSTEKEVVVLIEEEDKDGCFALKFPERTITFGSGFSKQKMVKTICGKFAQLVRYMDYESILSVFEGLSKILRVLLDGARQLEPKLKKIMNDNSQWGVKLYVANLGNTPFLIGKNAQLNVTNNDGAKYLKDCFLIVFKKDQDGDESKYVADSPVVVQAAGDISIEFVTSKTQCEMENGGIFREVFSSGKGQCWIKFDVEKVGLVRHQVIMSPKTIFKEDS